MRSLLSIVLTAALLGGSVADAAPGDPTCEELSMFLASEKGKDIKHGLVMWVRGIVLGLAYAESQIIAIAKAARKDGIGDDYVERVDAMREDISRLGFSPLTMGEAAGRIATLCEDPANASKSLGTATFEVLVELKARRDAEREKATP